MLNTIETSQKLIDFLTAKNINFKIIKDHDRQQLPKTMRVILLKILGFPVRYVLAVMPNESMINYAGLAKLFQVSRRHILLATANEVKYFTESEVHVIPPFIMSEHLHLIIDELVFQDKEIVFCPAREDRSIIMQTSDYQKIIEDVMLFSASFSKELKYA